MKKITRATFKSFIRKNKDIMYIRRSSSFDGMTDCVQSTGQQEFKSTEPTDKFLDYTLGIKGVWTVGGGRDYFKEYEDEQFKGIEVFNSCGSCVIAIRK